MASVCPVAGRDMTEQPVILAVDKLPLFVKGGLYGKIRHVRRKGMFRWSDLDGETMMLVKRDVKSIAG